MRRAMLACCRVASNDGVQDSIVVDISQGEDQFGVLACDTAEILRRSESAGTIPEQNLVVEHHVEMAVTIDVAQKHFAATRRDSEQSRDSQPSRTITEEDRDVVAAKVGDNYVEITVAIHVAYGEPSRSRAQGRERSERGIRGLRKNRSGKYQREDYNASHGRPHLVRV